ncbi:MAG: ABC transporter permease [Acidobacteria bacterium]|nr:ABC transporter permease [Acidobacteriota bacterium]
MKNQIIKFREWLALPGGFGIFAGLVMLGLLVILGIVIPNFGPYKSDEFIGDPFMPPSWQHPFGLDQLGRDVMTRTFASVGIDLGVAFLGVSIPLAIGTIIGILLGLAKNKYVLSLVGSLIDGINAFPLLIIAVAMLTFLGSGLKSVVIILAITNWARYARISRTRAVVVSKQNYIEAAKTLGYSKRRIVLKHIAPNVSSETVAYALSDFILVIVVVSGLSFLGLAARPPMAEWGSMIADGRAFLAQSWWLVIFPGLALCWSAVSLSFIVEGISRRDRGI